MTLPRNRISLSRAAPTADFVREFRSRLIANSGVSVVAMPAVFDTGSRTALTHATSVDRAEWQSHETSCAI